MRRAATWLVALALATAALERTGGTVAADEGKLEGQWKLVVLAFGDDDFLVFKAKQEGGEWTGEMGSAQRFLGDTSVAKIEVKGTAVDVMFSIGGEEDAFRGTLITQGDEAGRVLGTLRFRESVFPARLERSEQAKVGDLKQGPIPLKVRGAARERDAKARVEKLEAIIDESAAQPSVSQAYTALLRSASDAELTADQVRAHLDRWLGDAKPYGIEWLDQVRISALEALSGQQPYAELSVALAADADKALGPDASTEQQAALVKLYDAAAKAVGDTDLTRSLEGRLDRLEAKLDAEYHEKVPPFQPEPFAGRRTAQQDRTVLLELFTGAQCPPCVAADVGFDALGKSYRPTELIALQYHLHIPGPDPLTNPSSLARADFYGVQSTPSTFFNGILTAPGGGGMAQSKVKYDQYRAIIDETLYGKKAASIELAVKRTGDTIQIAASARAEPAPPAKPRDDKQEAKKKAADKNDAKDKDRADKDDAKDKQTKDEPKLRLRLVLTEESVKYVGGNRLRFHHHLVRALPGGADGIELADGKGQATLSLDLDTVREEINDYLDNFQKKGNFPNPVPPLELTGLSVIAFVQDDADKNVLEAVVAPVPDAE